VLSSGWSLEGKKKTHVGTEFIELAGPDSNGGRKWERGEKTAEGRKVGREAAEARRGISTSGDLAIHRLFRGFLQSHDNSMKTPPKQPTFPFFSLLIFPSFSRTRRVFASTHNTTPPYQFTPHNSNSASSFYFFSFFPPFFQRFVAKVTETPQKTPKTKEKKKQQKKNPKLSKPCVEASSFFFVSLLLFSAKPGPQEMLARRSLSRE
jgi:hypothetical protein